MAHTYRIVLFCLLLTVLYPLGTAAQSDDRIAQLGERLSAIAYEVPGLNEEVNISVSGASIQEFLRALAEAASLNINVSPDLDVRIYNNFQSETPRNILLFLAREYQLDFTFVGSIISVTGQLATPVAKEIQLSYDASSGKISMNLEQDSLIAVARKITDLSGANVIVGNALSAHLVSLYAQDMELEPALQQLAFNNHLKLVHTASGAYVLLPLGANEENYVNISNQLTTRRMPVAAPAEEGGAGQFYIDAGLADSGVPTLSIDATNMAIEEIIKNAAIQVNANYFLFSGIEGTTTANLQHVSFDDLLSTLLRGTEYTYKKENGIYMIGQRHLEGLREIRVIQLQNRSIDTIQAMIPNEWKQGIEIQEFREQNTLLLSGAGHQLAEVVSLIKQLDTRVPMVLIEVTILDIRKGYMVKTGISAGVSDSITNAGRLLPGIDYTFGAKSINNLLSRIGTGGAFNLGRVVPNFYVQLSALEDNNNVEMRAVPKLSTLNGHTASLSIGNKRYYSVSTQNVLGSLNPQTLVTEQYNEVEANMTIDIRPIVSGDEQVTLNIAIDISDFTQDTPLDQPPPTTTSKFESIIRVRNQETIVLGGIERFESTDNASGLPGIARIPILKWLFTKKSKGRNKVVSVMFIKPTIIYQ